PLKAPDRNAAHGFSLTFSLVVKRTIWRRQRSRTTTFHKHERSTYSKTKTKSGRRLRAEPVARFNKGERYEIFRKNGGASADHGNGGSRRPSAGAVRHGRSCRGRAV